MNYSSFESQVKDLRKEACLQICSTNFVRHYCIKVLNFRLVLLIFIGNFYISDINEFGKCINLLKMRNFKIIDLVQHSYKYIHVF